MHFCKLFIVKSNDVDDAKKQVSDLCDKYVKIQHDGGDSWVDYYTFGGGWDGYFKEETKLATELYDNIAPLPLAINQLKKIKSEFDKELIENKKNAILFLQGKKTNRYFSSYCLKYLANMINGDELCNDIVIWNVDTDSANNIPETDLDQYLVVVVDNHN